MTSPTAIAEAYTRTMASVAETMVASTKIANNMMVTSMESMRTAMDNTRDNFRDMTRLASSNARAIEEVARNMNTESTYSSYRRVWERDDGRQRRYMALMPQQSQGYKVIFCNPLFFDKG